LGRCLAIREQAAGPNSEATAAAYGELALCEWRENKMDKAMDHSTRLLAFAREAAAKTSADPGAVYFLASSLVMQGLIGAAMNRSAESQSHWREALSALQPLMKDAQDISAQATYAEILLCLGRTEEAKPIVQKVVGTGYEDPDLLALCGEKGLALGEPPNPTKL